MMSGTTLSLNRGFTRTDLLAVISAAVVGGVLITTPLRAAQHKGRLSVCSENLRQVARAVTLYTEANKNTLPAFTKANAPDLWWWYKEMVKGYAGLRGDSSANDKLFACPEDRGYSDAIPFWKSPRFDYGSYVYNGVTLPEMPNIAGLNLSVVNEPRRTLMVMEFSAHAPLSWHNSKTGRANSPFYCDAQSMVAFVDGHVHYSKIYYDGYNAAYTRDPIGGYDYKYSAK